MEPLPVKLEINNQIAALIMEALSSCCQGAAQSEVFLPVSQIVKRQTTEQIEAIAAERKTAATKAPEAKKEESDATPAN